MTQRSDFIKAKNKVGTPVLKGLNAYNSSKKSKEQAESFYNERSDYQKELNNMVHIYDGLRFMSPDGSFVIRFMYRNKIIDKTGKSFQIIYSMEQSDFAKLKDKKAIKINELKIPDIIESMGLIPYKYSVVAQWLNSKNHELNKKYEDACAEFTSDLDNWDDEIK